MTLLLLLTDTNRLTSYGILQTPHHESWIKDIDENISDKFAKIYNFEFWEKLQWVGGGDGGGIGDFGMAYCLYSSAFCKKTERDGKKRQTQISNMFNIRSSV